MAGGTSGNPGGGGSSRPASVQERLPVTRGDLPRRRCDSQSLGPPFRTTISGPKGPSQPRRRIKRPRLHHSAVLPVTAPHSSTADPASAAFQPGRRTEPRPGRREAGQREGRGGSARGGAAAAGGCPLPARSFSGQRLPGWSSTDCPAAMGSGGARAPTPRWGRLLGGAALLLPLLLSAAAEQTSPGTGEDGAGGWAHSSVGSPPHPARAADGGAPECPVRQVWPRRRRLEGSGPPFVLVPPLRPGPARLLCQGVRSAARPPCGAFSRGLRGRPGSAHCPPLTSPRPSALRKTALGCSFGDGK